MKVLSLTAGAASMVCGSCLRDNALAAELVARGHDVMLLPVYTPTHTDEENVSQKRVFFGGISVYLEEKLPMFRRTPALLDRLWDSASLIRFFSKRSIKTDAKMLGELTVSMLKGENGHQQKEVAKLVAWVRRHHPKPDVINLPFALLIGLARPLRQALGGSIVCTLQGEDLFLDALEEPYRTEALDLIRQQVEDVDLFLAVSEYYAQFMKGYLGIPPEKMRTAPLGINLKEFNYLRPASAAGRTAARSGSPQWQAPSRPFTIGYFARIAPEKGLDRLAAAYRILRQERDVPHARLEAAGWMGPKERGYLRKIEDELKDCGLDAEFHYRGELSRVDKVRFLSQLDVFSMPAPYREPKGLSVLEAMACGVPVVQPAHGAFPEMVRKTGGGVLVAPDNVEALAEGLWQLWQDPATRLRLAQRGAVTVRTHYDVGRMARAVEAVYEESQARTVVNPNQKLEFGSESTTEHEKAQGTR